MSGPMMTAGGPTGPMMTAGPPGGPTGPMMTAGGPGVQVTGPMMTAGGPVQMSGPMMTVGGAGQVRPGVMMQPGGPMPPGSIAMQQQMRPQMVAGQMQQRPIGAMTMGPGGMRPYQARPVGMMMPGQMQQVIGPGGQPTMQMVGAQGGMVTMGGQQIMRPRMPGPTWGHTQVSLEAVFSYIKTELKWQETLVCNSDSLFLHCTLQLL